MKVIIDARSISRTGIGVYTRNLIDGILEYKNSNKDFDIALTGDPKDIKKFFSDKVKIFSTSNSIYSLREQIETFLVELKNKGKFDFIHYLNYNKSLLSAMPYVVTIHDLIQFKFNTSSKVKKMIAKAVLKNTVKNAKAVICVSNFVKKELIEFCEVNEKKVFVVHNPIPKNYVDEKIEFQKPFKDYILCVGNRKPHKNFNVVIKSLELLKNKYPNLGLVIVGKRFENNDYIDDAIKSSTIKERILTLENIPYSYLSFLYKNANLTVSPSLSEGFGFVPFESLKFGTMPIISDIPVTRELFFDEDDKVFFDPTSPSELAKKIEEFIENSELRNKKINDMKKYLDFYSFDRFINGILNVYHKVMETL